MTNNHAGLTIYTVLLLNGLYVVVCHFKGSVMELSKDTHLVILSDCSLTQGLGEKNLHSLWTFELS
jgi:hypothetical protein